MRPTKGGMWSYLLLGASLAFVGGLPLGASNLAVIHHSKTHSLAKGMRIAYGAGLGEVLLALFALSYSNVLLGFFQMNVWIQWLFVAGFFALGVLLLLNYRLPKRRSKLPKLPAFSLGTFLALANPPVLFYWIVAISIVQPLFPGLSEMSPLMVLFGFFVGVFLGKIGVLYGYARWTRKLSDKRSSGQLQRILGLVLIGLSLAQSVRWAIS